MQISANCLDEADSEISYVAYDMRLGTATHALIVHVLVQWLIFIVAQERPCARCIKRNIGHLCHDERRETDSAAKKSKSHNSNSVEDEEASPDQPQSQPSVENGLNNPFDQSTDPTQENIGLGAPSIAQSAPLQIVQPSPVSGIQANALNSNSSHCMYLSPHLEAILKCL
jgi:DNA mismatch repair ATPase MutL